ncbi:hypothetical protein MUK70_15520 [Dyadobacter chenwenxiniae]|uniref:Uncharacterized protein n=1 Tax=Dyadobacter chenwenxiniae TaxID=2906456 RepID=A0A9X1PHX9_9BACT|nr:hypothetical protein [Dyadobacter chenwenxiniae]MCF0060650.1 hypothetical protein [Dyadobacter chenwenxiniae]UON80484.1 hypothetical protein MUK70_15520 [Dyadobacter chenwenxiniae]
MNRKSGKHWKQWADLNAPNSKGLMALDPHFRIQVKDFVEALVAAGAVVSVQATRRSARRAYLFHWSWLIALGKCSPSAATSMEGVDISWDHGNKMQSIAGAEEMVRAFGLAIPPRSNVAPALRSNHILGKAVDLDINWVGKIHVQKKDGTKIELTYQDNPNTNKKLIEVGKSYGLIKHLNDAPHWSVNGR